MKKNILNAIGRSIVILLFTAIFSGCSDAVQENSSQSISSVTNIVEKDMFLETLFDTMSDTFEVTKISDIPSKDENITTSTYSIINPEIPFMSMIHFSVNYDDRKIITNMGIMAPPDEYLWCSVALNQIAQSLDPNIDIEKLDKDCGLVPYSEEDIHIDTDLFSVFKMSSNDFISILITIKEKNPRYRQAPRGYYKRKGDIYYEKIYKVYHTSNRIRRCFLVHLGIFFNSIRLLQHEL